MFILHGSQILCVLQICTFKQHLHKSLVITPHGHGFRGFLINIDLFCSKTENILLFALTTVRTKIGSIFMLPNNIMKSRKHKKPKRKSRKYGGTPMNFNTFVSQIQNEENQSKINALVTNPENDIHVRSLLEICYEKIVVTSHPNKMRFYSREAEIIRNPIEIIYKIIRSPFYANAEAKALSALQPTVTSPKFFNEIALYMETHPDDLNIMLLHLFILYKPRFFMDYYLRGDEMFQTPNITMTILWSYVDLYGKHNENGIKPILIAYNQTNEQNMFNELLEGIDLQKLFFHAIFILDINHFERLFRHFNPSVELILPNFQMRSMLDCAIAYQHNDIAMFLINQGAKVSEFAITRLIVQPQANIELLKNALANGATIPENAIHLINSAPPSNNRNIKLEIINNWKQMMLTQALSHSNAGQHALASGLNEFKDF